MKTTLKEIWSKKPSKSMWDKLVDGLGMPKLKDLSEYEEAPDVEVSFRFILENNGWKDCRRVLQYVEEYDRELRLLAVAFAKQVKRFAKRRSARRALRIAERFANGRATKKDIVDAGDKARRDLRDAIPDLSAFPAFADLYPNHMAADNPRGLAFTCRVAVFANAATLADSALAYSAISTHYSHYSDYDAIDTPGMIASYTARLAAHATLRDAYHAAYDADLGHKYAYKKGLEAQDAAEQIQITEFKRFLDCIESNERYEISWLKRLNHCLKKSFMKM